MIASESSNLNRIKFKNLINFKFKLYFSFIEKKLRGVQQRLVKAKRYNVSNFSHLVLH